MQSSDLFAKAFESARSGLLLLETSTGRVLEVNSAFLRMCGRARGQVVGRIFWQAPLVADAQAGAEVFEHLRAGGAVQGAELPLETADGSCLLLDVSGKEPIAGVVQLEVQDATARESARLAQRMDAQRALAKRVAGEFTEMQQALQAAGEMLANCARRGQSTYLETDEIRRATDRAGGVVRELMAYGEQLALDPRPLNLNDLIESMEPPLQRLLGPEIRIVLELSPKMGLVMADPAQMRQILLKLGANSREAMERGGTFRIETRNASAEDPALGAAGQSGTYAMLAVSDDGPGMDDESWAHLYEPFFTTKTNGKRGLGLAAVHGIVRQSGGRLWADSEPGRGTSFRIYLPQAVAKPSATPAQPTLLLVEQNDGLRSVVTSILTKRGYRVLPAQEPSEALEVAKTQGARTLILNGHTGRAEAGTATLSKPFELETLLETVRGLLAVGPKV